MPRKLDSACRRTLWVGTVCLSVSLLSSCASKQAAASVPNPPVPVAVSAPVLGPLSVPQTQVVLPPAQSVPEGAVPPRQTTVAAMGPSQPVSSELDVPVGAGPAIRPAQPAARPVAVPQLGRILTAQQRQEYNRVIGQNVLAAQSSLDLLARRRLSATQQSGVNRVKAFLAQVDQARGSDLELARSLSDRARLLAEDMVRNLSR
jgi:hypothetical protein